jgi:transposase InsO family protein
MRPQYPLEYRQQIVELVRSGRSPKALAQEFEPSEQTIRNWVKQADLDSTLACELLDRRRFRSQAEARMAIFDWIEGWYNPRRRHSSLGRISPLNYERRLAVA